MARAESAETAEKNRVGWRPGRQDASPYLFFSATSAIAARDWF